MKEDIKHNVFLEKYLSDFKKLYFMADEYPSVLPEEYLPQEQQEDPTETQKIVEASMLQEERVSNFISQTSPVSSLERINYLLQGYTYSSADRQWKKMLGIKGIPDVMRNDIIQFLSPDLSEDTRMTSLSLEQINGLMQTVISFMKHYLYNAPKNIEIKELNRIFWIVVKAVFITVTRSRNGVERNRLYGSLKLGGTLDNQPEKENKDWWKVWK